MRPANLLYWAAALFLSCFFTPASAQTITLKGVVIEEFPVKEGKIKLWLPDDIRPGDMISGTVMAEPNGNNEKEKSRNIGLLPKYKVSAGPVITAVSSQRQPLKFIIAEFKSTLIALSDDKTVEITSFPVPTINSTRTQPTAITVPTHALTGSPLRITGPFDGDLGTTKCRLDGKEMEMLAESPGQTICTMSQITSGPHTLTIEENGRTTTANISAVNMDMTVDKTNLRTGQKAIITTSFSGLQNLPGNAVFSMTNTSSNTVNLIGGNNQTITIAPSQVSSSGTYTQTFTVQSISTGNFTVNADLDLPESPSTTSPVSTNWVACKIGNEIVMLPAATCEHMKQKINMASTPTTLSTGPATNPLSTGWSLQTTSTPDKQKLVNLIYANSFSPAIVFVDYRELGYTDRIPIISSNHMPVRTKNDSSWMIFFTPPSANTVYSIQATVYGDDDYRQSQHTLFYTTQYYKPEIHNSEIDSIRGVINGLDGEITRLQQEKADKEKQLFNSATHANEDTKKRDDEYSLYRQLDTIDVTMSGVWYGWSDSLRTFIDSLQGFLGREGELPVWELLGQKQRDAERASNGCENEMNNLEKEKEALEKEISDLDKQYQQTIDDMKKLVEKNHPYLRFQATTYKDKKGGLHTIVDLYLQAAGNTETIVNYGPSDIPDIKDAYNALKATLKAAAAKQNADRKRLAEIPGDMEKLKAECEKKKEELAKANKEKETGVAKLTKNEWLNSDIDGLCNRIRTALEDLVDWCKKHKGQCNDDYEARANQMREKCPHTKTEFEQYRNMFNNIIFSKQAMEKTHRENGDFWNGQTVKDNKEIGKTQAEIDSIQNKIDDAGSELSYAKNQEERAVDRETYRRDAEKARQSKAEQDAIAKRKLICGEFVKSQMKTEAEQQWFNAILRIKSAMQNMGDEVEEASQTIRLLPGGKRFERLKKIADKFSDMVGALLEPLKKFDELKEKIEGILNRINQMKTLLSSTNTPQENAKKFGELLGIVNDGLSEISNKFPVLQFFTAYFSYLVEGYNAAVNGIFDTFSREYKRIVDDCMEQNISCEGLFNAYMQKKDLADVYKKAFEACEGKYYSQNNVQKDVFMQEIEKAALKKLMDCCMTWILVPN